MNHPAPATSAAVPSPVPAWVYAPAVLKPAEIERELRLRRMLVD